MVHETCTLTHRDGPSSPHGEIYQFHSEGNALHPYGSYVLTSDV